MHLTKTTEIFALTLWFEYQYCAYQRFCPLWKLAIDVYVLGVGVGVGIGIGVGVSNLGLSQTLL